MVTWHQQQKHQRSVFYFNFFPMQLYFVLRLFTLTQRLFLINFGHPPPRQRPCRGNSSVHRWRWNAAVLCPTWANGHMVKSARSLLGSRYLTLYLFYFLIRKCTSSLVERRPRYTSADETCLLLYVWTTAFVKSVVIGAGAGPWKCLGRMNVRLCGSDSAPAPF